MVAPYLVPAVTVVDIIDEGREPRALQVLPEGIPEFCSHFGTTVFDVVEVKGGILVLADCPVVGVPYDKAVTARPEELRHENTGLALRLDGQERIGEGEEVPSCYVKCRLFRFGVSFDGNLNVFGTEPPCRFVPAAGGQFAFLDDVCTLAGLLDLFAAYVIIALLDENPAFFDCPCFGDKIEVHLVAFDHVIAVFEDHVPFGVNFLCLVVICHEIGPQEP